MLLSSIRRATESIQRRIQAFEGGLCGHVSLDIVGRDRVLIFQAVICDRQSTGSFSIRTAAEKRV